MKVLNKCSDVINSITLKLASIAIASVMLVVLIQVVLRFFDMGLRWSDTYCRYMTIWAVMLGGNVLIKQGELLASNFFENLFPKTFLAIRDYLYIVVFLLLLTVLTHQGWIQAWQNRVQNINALPVTMFWAYLAVPVGTSLMLFQYIVKALNLIRDTVKQKGANAQ